MTNLQKQVLEKETEISLLNHRIQELTNDVLLAKSIKESKEIKFPGSSSPHQQHHHQIMNEDDREGGGIDPGQEYINTKMKKIMNRRRMVDIARAQAEEIDYLRQELDRMRQRTFPSFVK
jgi:hypothetical protein